MLVSPGQFISCTKRNNNGVPAISLNGLLIDFNYTTNWVGPTKIAIYGGGTDIVESMVASTPAQQIITGFGDLAAGEFNTDSDYNSNVTYWNEVWPGVNSRPHWNDAKTAGFNAWFKFPTQLSFLTKIMIRLRNTPAYGLPPNPLFSDMTGKFYVPVSAPSDLNDYVDAIGNDRTYEYLFA